MRNIFTDLFRKPSMLLALIIASTTAFAQQQVTSPGVVSQLTLDSEGRIKCELHAHDAISQEHHSTTQNARFENAKKGKSKKKNRGGATINISIFNFDPTFSQVNQASAAFASAIEIWSSNLQSDVPIEVALVFQPLDDGVLGSAGPTFIFRDSPGLERGTWYGNALADKLSGEDLSPGEFDIIARFSTVFPNWYFGTDANTPADDFDFRTVVLHELCHGLGYFGSMFVDNATGVGDWGFGIPDENGVFFPAIYDRLMLDRNGKQLIKENKFPNFSTELGEALLTGPILARGARINKATNGKGMPTFTTLDSDVFGDIPGFTDIWLPGSSYSHQDFVTYAGTPEGLMVPFLDRGLAVTEPGPLVLALFDDIGWDGKVNRAVPEATARVAPMPNEEYTSPLNVYPNEVQGQFVLDLGSEEGALQSAQMVDVLGRSYPLTFSKRSSRYIDFDLSSSSAKSGIYFLQLEFSDRKAEVLRLAKVQ